MPNTVTKYHLFCLPHVCLKSLCLAQEFAHWVAKYEEMKSSKSQIHLLEDRKSLGVRMDRGL